MTRVPAKEGEAAISPRSLGHSSGGLPQPRRQRPWTLDDCRENVYCFVANRYAKFIENALMVANTGLESVSTEKWRMELAKVGLGLPACLIVSSGRGASPRRGRSPPERLSGAAAHPPAPEPEPTGPEPAHCRAFHTANPCSRILERPGSSQLGQVCEAVSGTRRTRLLPVGAPWVREKSGGFEHVSSVTASPGSRSQPSPLSRTQGDQFHVSDRRPRQSTLS